MPERRELAAQLVRIQARIWSAEDAYTRGRLQRMKLEIERKLAALDSADLARRATLAAAKPVEG